MNQPLPVTPGDYIRQKLAEKRWMQRDLAFWLGVTEQTINLIVSGKRGISADMARLLAVAFNDSAEHIFQIQKNYELTQELASAKEPNPSVIKRIKLHEYPLREMIKRGWIDDDSSVDLQLAKFFGVTSVEELPHIAHAAKKTQQETELPSALQIAWIHRVRQIAQEMIVPSYSERKLREALPRLQALTSAPEEARHVARILSECGVRFVLVESLPSAKIDGVCLWVNNGTSPVIGLSMRFDRIDNFWFVLRHEIEHVLRRDGVLQAVSDELEGDNAGTGMHLSDEERAANAAASEFCVPQSELDLWIRRKQPYFSEHDLMGFSRRLQLHPGLVAGQLRNKTKNWKIFTKHLVKIRSNVTATALYDGWGQIAPVSGQ